MCWPHIELDSGVSPTDEIDVFSALHDWRTCFAESHNSRLFQQCVKLELVKIRNFSHETSDIANRLGLRKQLIEKAESGR